MAPTRQRWPVGRHTVFFEDVASRTTLSRAVSEGRIRRLAPRVYTADRTSEAAAVVRANWSAICAHYLPGAVIVDRSAARGNVDDGSLTVATSTNRKSIKLPGLEIRVRDGGPYTSDLPWSHGLAMSSPARVLVDNLEPSRARGGRPSRTLSLDELEDWVASKYLAWGSERADRLWRSARSLAEETGRSEHLAAIDGIFQRLRGAAPQRPRAGKFFKAVAGGQPWDERRLELFDHAISALGQIGPPDVPVFFPEPTEPSELPFYESYFSNFIEGTTFTVEEARQIVATSTPPADRQADGHDILGTLRCVAHPEGRAATSVNPSELVELLRSRHREIMGGRPNKHPGEWKTKRNFVGTHEFVAPELVEGTLIAGLRRMAELPEGMPRALYVMLVVSEVHPFTDGNGRVARVMMNAELSAVGAARIVIPNVYRDEYLSALRNVSVTDGDLTAYIRVMTHAWRWTAAMPWADAAATEGQLIATNAHLDSIEATQAGRRLKLP